MGEGVYPKPVESSVTGLSTKTADRQGTLFSQERFIQAVIRAEASNFRTLNELDAMLPGTDLLILKSRGASACCLAPGFGSPSRQRVRRTSAILRFSRRSAISLGVSPSDR